ncbi:hypothetical protein B7P43_G10561 [Cryptotermes secundus]|uniref:Serine/threonine-protein kinase 11-interacting protein n=1 Tax=Cryptotermes secundus TaxID=105785 RepID=A0A2J7PX74_9NEOP|nr:hypothetical protein B7P43_G10561 [Cryptotermes secundus]
MLYVISRQLKEREVLCGKTHERWTMASLLSCNRIRGEGPTATVHLTFDTVRRDRQERVYVMEEKDAQKLVRTLGEVLDARPLTAMNQLVFRCMKCSTQFSKELPVTGVGEKMLTCPTCNSTLVIEMDEIPLPSHYRNDRGEKQFVAVENGPLSSGLHSSPSQSSIGRPVSDTGASTVMYGGDRLQVTAMIHHNEAQQQPSRSAASLDPFADSPNNMRVAVKQWDSDIEIISNPSQSSIEVLYEHARLQGGVAPASSRSSEEKQMVSVAVTSQQPVVPEAASHVVTLTGLTESSSSSSLTDSICTTYEIHSESLSLRQESMTANLEERQSIITVSDRNTSTNTKVNEGMHETAEKLSDGSVKKSVHEDENPEMLFKMHEEKLSSRMNYASMLEGLLQSVGSKLPSKSSENVIESSDSRGAVIGNDGVKYSYSDFSIVDHRVKLHLYLHVFQQEQEELLFLLRAHIVPLSATLSYPGCLVMSSRKVYILQITGEEGDDPEKWLRKVESSPIETAILLFPLLCQQGIGMELLHEGGEQPSCFLFILPDPNYTVNFFSFLTGVRLPEQCKVDHAVVERQTLAVQQLLLSAAASDATDPTICACAVSYSCSIQRNKEKKDVGMGAITVTTTDLLLMMDNLQWLFPKSTVPPHTHSGQITNLIEVEMEDQCQLTLHFLDEAAGSDESWTLKFGSDSTLESIVSAIRIPWEQLFSVPLQIVNKNISVV